MSQHMVIFQNPEGDPGYNQFESIEEAVSFVEKIRNEQGIDSIRIFELEEVKFDLKPYFKVELLALKAGAPAAAAPHLLLLRHPPRPRRPRHPLPPRHPSPLRLRPGAGTRARAGEPVRGAQRPARPAVRLPAALRRPRRSHAAGGQARRRAAADPPGPLRSLITPVAGRPLRTASTSTCVATPNCSVPGPSVRARSSVGAQRRR